MTPERNEITLVVDGVEVQAREGEMLVSMGVTYWQLGEQARALQLTQSGVNLVEMAVEDGILSADRP